MLHESHIKNTLTQRPSESVWDYNESVFSTWELSYGQIEKKQPHSARLLTLCSFLSSTEIYPDMLEKGIQIVEPKSLSCKYKRSLIEIC